MASKVITFSILSFLLFTNVSLLLGLMEIGNNSTIQSNNCEIDSSHLTNGMKNPINSNHFIKNEGQIPNNNIHYYSSNDINIGFKNNSVVYSINEDGTFSFEIIFIDSNSVKPIAVEKGISIYNYFTKDIKCSNVESYRKIVYYNIWDGVDIEYYYQNNLLKYDIIVHPGADISNIRYEVSGSEVYSSSDNNKIHFKTPFGIITDDKLIATQEDRIIPIRFNVEDNCYYSFEIDEYNPKQELLIDPIITYSSFLGGKQAEYSRNGYDEFNGNVYVYGDTTSIDFPTTPGVIDRSISNQDLFISCFDSTFSNLVFSTFIGGSEIDHAEGIDIDPSGNIIITGSTESSDFPTTNGSMNETSKIRTEHDGDIVCDGFICKISQNGSSLAYSTFITGNEYDEGKEITVDSSGNVYVCGLTKSKDFFTNNGYNSKLNGGGDIFIMKINQNGSYPIYSTYLGGTSSRDYCKGIKVNEQGEAIITGYTDSQDYPTTSGAYKTTQTGDEIGFITCLSLSGSSLIFSTLIIDELSIYSLELCNDGIWIGGATRNQQMPISNDAYQKKSSISSGYGDGFLIKMDRTGSSLLYCTYIGGNHIEEISDIAIDEKGQILFSGITASTDLNTTFGATHPTNQGQFDGFFGKLSKNLQSVDLLSYIGGNAYDVVMWIHPDDEWNITIGGKTSSNDFPVTSGSYDNSVNGGEDIFFASIRLDLFPPDPPENLRIKRGNSFLKLFWKPPFKDGNRSIVNYSIFFSEDNLTFNKLFDLNAGDDLEYNHTKLENGNEYYYYLTCSNEIGESYPSKIVSSIPAKPPSIPEWKRYETGDGFVNLKWYEPDNLGGDANITYNLYLVEDQKDYIILNRNISNLFYNHSGLINGESYFYSISASNSMGEGKLSGFLKATPIRKPTEPLNISFSRGDGFIHIFWEKPLENGGQEDLKFNVYYRNMEKEDQFSLWGKNISDTNENLTGLVNGDEYTISITAVNIKGESPFSEVVVTKPIGVPSQPRNLILDFTDGRVSLSWHKPTNFGGDEKVLYSIYMSTQGDGPDRIVTNIAETSYKLPGLRNGISYEFFVTAINELHESKASDIASGIPIGPATEPLNISANSFETSVTITWNEPVDNGGDDHLIYGIHFGESNTDPTLVAESLDYSYKINGLEIGKTYYYYISVRNSFGDGSNSEIQSMIISTKPGIPTWINQEKGDKTILLNWKKPEYDGGLNDIRYNIYFNESGKELEKIKWNITNNSYIITGLTNGFAYDIAISALNLEGEGPLTEIKTVIPVGTPEYPFILSLTSEGDDITLSWDSPENSGGSPFTEIQIYRWKGNDKPTLLTTLKDENTLYEDSDLGNGEYKYKIVGITEYGITPDSNVVSGKIEEDKPSSSFILFFIILLIGSLVSTILIIFFIIKRNKTNIETHQVKNQVFHIHQTTTEEKNSEPMIDQK